MIVASTGLEWKNCENNGLCVDIIPSIQKGYEELSKFPNKYKKYEAKNGWGTVEGTKNFFLNILKEWEDFKYCHPKLENIATFWIE